MIQSKPFILVVIIVVFLGGSLLYIYNPEPTKYRNPKNETVACTMEAKMCPDGSYVGRTGPKCEFETCPPPKATSTEIEVQL